MEDYIKRDDAIDAICGITMCRGQIPFDTVKFKLENIPSADVVEFPITGIGDLSDGYHTFNGLYEQRMILFAALVKAYKDRAWKSYKHEDGEYCFGGGWFIVGIDTPEGSYTYHYENKFWDLFDCKDLPCSPHWDGHTEADAEVRLLSLPDVVERKKGYDIKREWSSLFQCSVCGCTCWDTIPCDIREFKFCPNCGAEMESNE